VFGYAAGNTITSGTDLTLIGNQAGQLINSGVRNTAVGNEAMMNTTTGSNNTALGEEALRQGTGGNRTAVGYASCFNCTGSDVVAMGVNAMFANTTGANNTGIGSGAIQNNATGAGNVAVGMNALFGVAANSHSNNTAVGLRAGQATTTGSFNIFIGDSAGVTQTTGIRNILVGTGVLASAVTASNEMNIGGLLFGTGMTATSTSVAGSLGVAVAPGSISARLHLPAGTATASTAPLKFTAGTNLSTIEAAAVEYNNAYYASTNALNRLGIGGVIYTASDSVVNNGNSATTLMTITTKANTLAAVNEAVIATISGTFNDATGTETMALTFAGTNILNIAPAGNPTGWKIKVSVVRTGASTAQATVDFFDDLEFHNAVITQLSGLTFSNTNALVLTGTSSTAVARAIVRNQYRMYWEPAAAN